MKRPEVSIVWAAVAGVGFVVLAGWDCGAWCCGRRVFGRVGLSCSGCSRRLA